MYTEKKSQQACPMWELYDTQNLNYQKYIGPVLWVKCERKAELHSASIFCNAQFFL